MKRRSTQGYKNKVGYVCMNCGGLGNIAHHIVPLSKGGLDHPDNWMILCGKCHDKEQVHKYADELELPLAIKKHYFELGQEIEKIPQAFIIGPQRTINLIHPITQVKPLRTPQVKIEASTRITRVCKHCKKPFSAKRTSIYCSSTCRYAYHNQIRKNKEISIEDSILNHYRRVGWNSYKEGKQLKGVYLQLDYFTRMVGLLKSRKWENLDKQALKELDVICVKTIELYGYEVKKKGE